MQSPEASRTPSRTIALRPRAFVLAIFLATTLFAQNADAAAPNLFFHISTEDVFVTPDVDPPTLRDVPQDATGSLSVAPVVDASSAGSPPDEQTATLPDLPGPEPQEAATAADLPAAHARSDAAALAEETVAEGPEGATATVDEKRVVAQDDASQLEASPAESLSRFAPRIQYFLPTPRGAVSLNGGGEPVATRAPAEAHPWSRSPLRAVVPLPVASSAPAPLPIPKDSPAPAPATHPAQRDPSGAQISFARIATAGLVVAPTVAYPAALAAGVVLVLVGVSLYTLLSRRDLLKNDVRRGIFDRIQENPGLTTAQIARGVGVRYQTVSYHLVALEKAGYISLQMHGRRAHFFANTGRLTQEIRLLTPLARDASALKALAVIQANPGVMLTEVGALMGYTPTTGVWHVKKLVHAGLVVSEKSQGCCRLRVDAQRLAVFEALRSQEAATPEPSSEPAGHSGTISGV